MIKQFLKKKISYTTKGKLRRLFIEGKAIIAQYSLNKLGKIYATDKVGSHHYTQHYNTHFKKHRLKRINLLEIGVGGYSNPSAGGNSLRMWKRYFPFGKIYSIDIYDKSALQEKRIKIFKGSQVDVDFLEQVADEIGQIDFIIDDGSHINEHVIKTFQILFPKLKEHGIYVIEDTQTSYWEEYGGSSKDLNKSDTIMNYFKSLIDSLNHQEFIIPNYKPSYYDQKIISMHFYHNLIFIYKGNNDEISNILVNNQMPNI
ncbi:MAG: class I SAM-dependent methyltransferase [Bacteroidales bacterium]|nr:class I SAM-dependent methyltransferase [Bacteroidales bacterium]